MAKQAKRVKLNIRETTPDRWVWHAPEASLPAKEYGAAMLRNARRYARNPDALNRYDGSVSPGYGSDTELALDVSIGGGWGARRRVRAAVWAGGKAWIVREIPRGYEGALKVLALPMSDGRYLLQGAPERPEKGVNAWRDRWTVSRADLAGLSVVAGEGVDGRERRARLVQVAKRARVDAAIERDTAETLRARLAEMPEGNPYAESFETLTRRLTTCGIGVGNASHFSYEIRTQARTRDQRREQAVYTRAAEALERHSKVKRLQPPLKLGVRSTRANGEPNGDHVARYGRDVYTGAMEVGVAATAPDWDDHKGCGNGLHYAPLHVALPARDMTCSDVVTEAMRYGSSRDFALWIVKAQDVRNAVQIDRKAKAQTLIPLECVGRYKQHQRYRRILALIENYERYTSQRLHVVRKLAEAEKAQAKHERKAKRTRALLRDWNKA